MQLHELTSFRKKRSMRVGRGGKRGTTSGRGTKGQKSRAGHVIRPAERDLIMRIPKRRGVKNKPTSVKSAAINLGDLMGFEGAVTPASLRKAGILASRAKEVKILGGGEAPPSLQVVGVAVSKTAKEKIEKAGGSVTNNPE